MINWTSDPNLNAIGMIIKTREQLISSDSHDLYQKSLHFSCHCPIFLETIQYCDVTAKFILESVSLFQLGVHHTGNFKTLAKTSKAKPWDQIDD